MSYGECGRRVLGAGDTGREGGGAAGHCCGGPALQESGTALQESGPALQESGPAQLRYIAAQLP
jgi:hypothetical protein